MQKDLSRYPRRRTRRKFIRTIGRLIIRLFTDFSLEGEDNFPKNGPYIMAGNHVAAMEVLLMALFSPQHIEILGAGDIPLDPNLAPFANLHGYIPIDRGSVDQKGLNLAVNVLKKGGVIGIFPEGGIWNRNLSQAKLGVSWISHRSHTPVLPVGFIGMHGALRQMLRLKRPKITMRVGKLLPYHFLFSDENEKTLKIQLQDAADKIMNSIKYLLPIEEQDAADEVETHCKPLKFQYFLNGDLLDFNFEHKNSLSMMLTHPVIMDVYRRNLKLPIRGLASFNKKIKLELMIKSIFSINNYLIEKPNFLIYRFGTDLGRDMESGLRNYLLELEKIKGNKEIMVYISESS